MPVTGSYNAVLHLGMHIKAVQQGYSPERFGNPATGSITKQNRGQDAVSFQLYQ